MPYEVFTRKIARLGTPTVTLSKNGSIGFNHAATAILKANVVEFAIMLFDRERNKIAVRPISKKDSRAYSITYNKRSSSSGFSFKTFLDFIGYNYSETRSYPAEWNANEGILEVEIPAEYFNQRSHQRVLPMQPAGKSPKSATK